MNIMGRVGCTDKMVNRNGNGQQRHGKGGMHKQTDQTSPAPEPRSLLCNAPRHGCYAPGHCQGFLHLGNTGSFSKLTGLYNSTICSLPQADHKSGNSLNNGKEGCTNMLWSPHNDTEGMHKKAGHLRMAMVINLMAML